MRRDRVIPEVRGKEVPLLPLLARFCFSFVLLVLGQLGFKCRALQMRDGPALTRG